LAQKEEDSEDDIEPFQPEDIIDRVSKKGPKDTNVKIAKLTDKKKIYIDEDAFDRFIAETCERKYDSFIECKVLYQLYVKWSTKNGGTVMTKERFYVEMARYDNNFRKKLTFPSRKMAYYGLKMKIINNI
jgi:phage/plasmid-associated DNA primase